MRENKAICDLRSNAGKIKTHMGIHTNSRYFMPGS